MTEDTSMGLAIGEVAERAGIAASALRYYEQQGLITSTRTAGSQRRYQRDVLRRLAFIGAAKRIGLDLGEIRQALDTLPERRTPTAADWAKLSRSWRAQLDAEIEQLVRLRDELSQCIGCGCLSLKACALYNPDDRARRGGPGPRFLLGDRPEPIG